MSTRQEGLMGRIQIRYPRLVIVFGWTVVLASAAVTFGIFYAIFYMLAAVWPGMEGWAP
jgi:hypothetical protein